VNAVLPASARSGSDRCDVVSIDRFCVYTRDPQVGLFRVWRDGIGTSVFTDLWVISNHFSSTPDRRVAQRTQQAAYQVAIVAAIEDADPQARVISGGDFNVYPRPDDPFFGGSESDQLGPMYDAGLRNLFDTLVAEVPQSAYSYSFQGQAQTLDMQWANDAQFDDLVQVRAAHLNADFAADYFGDSARGASDHDPQIARWWMDVTFDRLEALARYYGETGAIHRPSQAAALAARLDRAEDLLHQGKIAAFEDQVQAFLDQVEDWTPDQIEPTAADALTSELERLVASLD
jgi:hypothetical protein